MYRGLSSLFIQKISVFQDFNLSAHPLAILLESPSQRLIGFASRIEISSGFARTLDIARMYRKYNI